MGTHFLSGYPERMRSSLLVFLCLVALSARLALAEDDYNMMVCHESEGVNPENDAEVDKHCTHQKVDSRSIPESDLNEADPLDRLFGLKCWLYQGSCQSGCAAKGYVGECILRWYWWIIVIKEVRCDCQIYGPTTPTTPTTPTAATT